MILSNTLTTYIKIQNSLEVKKIAFKYTSKNNHSELDLNEFIELVYKKMNSIIKINLYKISIEIYVGEHLLSRTDNSNSNELSLIFTNFADILLNVDLYSKYKNAYTKYFKNRINTIHSQIKKGRIFKVIKIINTTNIIKSSNDKRDVNI